MYVAMYLKNSIFLSTWYIIIRFIGRQFIISLGRLIVLIRPWVFFVLFRVIKQ